MRFRETILGTYIYVVMGCSYKMIPPHHSNPNRAPTYQIPIPAFAHRSGRKGPEAAQSPPPTVAPQDALTLRPLN